MKDIFTIDDLTLITGLSSRSIRTYISEGFISGDKSSGSWKFTSEQVDAFLQNQYIQPVLHSKRNAIVYDFLGAKPSGRDKMCVILDISSDKRISASQIFCRLMSDYRSPEVELHFASEPLEKGLRVILSGSDADVTNLLKHYYLET